MNAPAMKLTLVIEGSQGPGAGAEDHSPDAAVNSLAEIIADPEIQAEYAELAPESSAKHRRHPEGRALRPRRDLFRSGGIRNRRIQQVHSVLLVSGFRVHGFGVDVEFPDESFGRIEPWVREPLRHNLATICERYGGGGHPKVGAISFPIGAVVEARKAAAEIREELKIT